MKTGRRFPKQMEDDMLVLMLSLLQTREQLHAKQLALGKELETIDDMQKETLAALTNGARFLHTFGVKLPEAAYTLIGLFDDGTEPPP